MARNQSRMVPGRAAGRGCASDRDHGSAFTWSRHSIFVAGERKVVLAGQVKAASPLCPRRAQREQSPVRPPRQSEL